MHNSAQCCDLVPLDGRQKRGQINTKPVIFQAQEEAPWSGQDSSQVKREAILHIS